MLVADIGYQESAQRTGIAANTLYQWARRYQWNTPIPHSQKTVRTVSSPADAQAKALRECKDRSKVALARYSAEASEDAAKHKNKLKIARAVRDVAAVHSSLWPEDHNERGIVNLNVLAGGRAAIQINDRPA